MIFNHGQAFSNMEGDLRAPKRVDNLIHRREIRAMLAVFINPAALLEEPEPDPQEWGRQNHQPSDPIQLALRSGHARHRRRADAGVYKDYAISKDREYDGIVGASPQPSGIHGGLGTSQRLLGGAQPDRQLHEAVRLGCLRQHRLGRARKPIRIRHAGNGGRQTRERPRRAPTIRRAHPASRMFSSTKAF